LAEAFTSALSGPAMSGRADQLADLHLLIERARDAHGHLALLSGEAGIGKTRLVGAAKAYAAQQGFLLLQGNCFPTDLNFPYAPLLDLLRSLLASSPPASTVTSLQALARTIFPLLPELVPEPQKAPPALEPEQEKHRLLAVLSTFFINLSKQSPLLFVIEDVHWCDDTSLDFLNYLARRAASQQLLILVTYRHDEEHAALRNWLVQLNRERLAQEIRLEPLGRSSVDAMLSSMFDHSHTAVDMRRFLHGELLEAIYTLTEGNPFVVEETLTSLIATGTLYFARGYWQRASRGELHIPRSIHDAVLRRMEHVSEAARQVLTLAAVAGRQFDFALLQRLTRYDEERLLLLMKELLAAQLVVEESAERFAFRHALTRQAIYTQLLARERVALHRTIAETLEQQAVDALERWQEELAYHSYQARLWRKTLDYAQRAGAKALNLYSHRAAIDYFSWSLDASEQLSIPPASELYRARGQAYETLGEFEQAQYNYTQALQAARARDDRVAEWQGVMDLGFLWAGRDYAQAERWLHQALALAQALNDPALRARSLNRVANWHLNVEQPREALRYHQEALRIFEQLHDERGIAETLDLLGMVSYLAGDLRHGTQYYRQAIALFERLGDQQGLTSSLATLALRGPTFQTDALVAAESLAVAQQDVEGALRIAREIGHRGDEAYALFQLGLCLGSQGKYGRALEFVRQSLDIAEEIEHRQWQTAALTVQGGIYCSLLAFPEARASFEQARALASEIGSLFWTRIATGYLVSAAVQAGDLDEAAAVLHAAYGTDAPAQTMAERMLWCASIELALARAEPARALEAIDRLLAPGAPAEERGSLRVLQLRGKALLALQRPAEAEASLREAREIAVAQSVRPADWRICIALGMLERARSRNAEAEREFATARALVNELGATLTDGPLRDTFLSQAAALFPQAQPRSARQAAREAFGGLTVREREVALQLAQGKFNREIAEALVVSERTVETHVSHIMFKLGFTTRRQIAAWTVEKGLLEKGE
jgi:predicted ATPase/DNA-binding CsgD family transcriptional regulator